MITVNFTPGNANVQDTLSIPVTATGAGGLSTTYTVALSGTYTASAAGVTIVPAIANFGSANVDTQGITQQFTITNSTRKTLALSLDLPRQYVLVGAPCTALAAGASCTFSLQFVPLTNGTVAGSILAQATPSDGSATVTSIAYVEGYGTGKGTLTLSGGLIVSGVYGFEQVASGQTASQTFTLTNNGTSPMTVRRVTTAPPFLSTTSCGGSLAVAQTCAVIVTYAPNNQVASGTSSPAATNDAGTLTVESDALTSPVILNLTGQAGPLAVSNPTATATLATFTLSQGSLTFASAMVGNTTTAQSFTLTNTGTQAMQITSISATVDFSIQSNCTTVIAGASCTISVTSTPQTAGTHIAALSIVSNATTSLEFVSLISTATPSPLQVTPSPLAFPSLLVGASATLPVQVTNTGSTPITFTSVAASGDYTIAGTCPAAGATLAANATCTEQVTFAPSTMGSRSGLLSFSTSASAQPLTVALNGIGTKPQLAFSASTLSFGNVMLGSTSSLQLTLTNNSTTLVSALALAISGDYIVSSPCGATSLAAGAACLVELTFTPSAAGTRNGSLTITSSDPASPTTISLNGTGTVINGGFTLTVDNTTETAQSGKPAIYNLTITPTGGFVGTVALTCAPIGTAQYVSCSVLQPSIALSGGAQSSVVTINTVTSIAAGSFPQRAGDIFACLLAPCLLLMWRDRRSLRRHRLLLAAMFFCAATLFSSGCGNNQNLNLRYANAGSYQFVITGASTTGVPAMQTMTITLAVTPQ